MPEVNLVAGQTEDPATMCRMAAWSGFGLTKKTTCYGVCAKRANKGMILYRVLAVAVSVFN